MNLHVPVYTHLVDIGIHYRGVSPSPRGPPLPSPPSPPAPFPTHALPGAPEEEGREVDGEEGCLEVGPEKRLIVALIMKKVLSTKQNHSVYEIIH